VNEPAAIPTTAKRVTFFEDRAEVVRVGKASLGEGRQWVRLSGATTLLDDRSVQAKALSDRVQVLSARVVRRVRSVTSLTPEEAQKLQQAVRESELERDELYTTTSRLARRSNYLDQLIASWCGNVAGVPAPGRDSAPPEWREAWESMLTRDDEMLAERFDLNEKTEDVETELNERIFKLQNASTSQTLFECFIEVQVDASSMDDVELQVTYRTPCALWRPEHLARLNRDAKQAKSGELEWTTWAVVWQRTGEDWKDVELAFSTARPAQVADAPELTDDSLSKRKKTAEEKKQIVVEMREQTIASSADRSEPEMPGVDDGGKPLEFTPKGAYSQSSSGQPTRVEIGRRSMKAAVSLVLMPERAQTAFLKADANWEGDAPILAGPLGLARGGAMVGRSRVKFVASGEKFETGFGPEDGIRCKRAQREDREQAKLTGSQTIERKVTLRLSNLGDSARELEVIERIPVSEIEGLEVKLTDGKDWQLDKDGYLRRTVKLEPRGQLTLEYEYEIKAKGNVVLPF